MFKAIEDVPRGRGRYYRSTVRPAYGSFETDSRRRRISLILCAPLYVKLTKDGCSFIAEVGLAELAQFGYPGRRDWCSW